MANMTSLVTGYSSEEEEDKNYESTSKTSRNGQMQRQKDVNYDDVKMDMSDESDREKEEKRKSDSDVSNSEDTKADPKQLNHSEESTVRSKERSSDEDRPHSKHSRHRSHRHHRRHREERSRHDGDRHRRKHRRRSRSRDQRRSRSRDRSRSSRDDPEYDDRMSKHSRKLKALGLVGQKSNEEAGEASVSESSGKKFPSGSASGLLINEGVVKKQVEAQVAQVKQITGVELPKYYNPTAINPLRYADQIKKRKLLWSKPTSSHVAEDKPSVESEGNGSGNNRGKDRNAKHESGHQSSSYNNWESTNFGNSQANEKFRRLMGIKTTSVPSANSGNEGSVNQKMFQDLDKQYEKARMTTHTARGLGLGFTNPPIPMNSSVGAVDDNAKISKK